MVRPILPGSLRRRFSLLALTFSINFAATACQPRQSGETPSDTEAITNRPQNYDRIIAIVKLKTPALLSTAKKAGGEVSFDASLAKAIAEEQDTSIAELQALSPDLHVLYRYRFVLNGVAVVAPRELESKLRGLTSVAYVEKEAEFQRLKPLATDSSATNEADIATHNSTTFIGAGKVHNDLQLTGKGITVGVIDTGIDYTHAMFGGVGTEQAYKDIDPAKAATGFPSTKVVGGIDLVGTEYDSASANFANHVPKPDANPLDEQGHGSHVAGTIAGLGDGVNTYSGVAPDAKLYAIKVFGKKGSTGDAVVLAALEHAANPSGDGSGKDHLDVVNLSLGSSFGTPHILYSEAVANLVKGDTVVVASAGNSGDYQYIVGAPSTSSDALSVAASIDDMDHNWKFKAVAFKTAQHPEIFSEAIEGSFAKPISDVGDLSGKLVYVGTAADELTDAQKAAVKGNVALIDRGAVTFAIKAKRAKDAGAAGLVVVNNVDGAPFVMGGDDKVGFPAIMIAKSLGDTLKADMAQGDAVISWQTDHKIEKPELIDTLTDFSSRGPRSVDGALKPEIAAPGANVISAKMGSGKDGVKFSGTSMAAPHMSGVVALLKQGRPELDVQGVKSLLMATAQPMKNPKTQKRYSVAYMGAGRVQAFAALTAKLLTSPQSLALGEVLVEQAKTVRKSLTLTNLTDKEQELTLSSEVKTGLQLTLPANLTLAAHSAKNIDVFVRIAPPKVDDASQELDGYIKITSSIGGSYLVPLLAVVNRTTRVEANAFVVHATSAADAAGAEGEVTLKNAGLAKGEALLFNLLGTDERKDKARVNEARNGICDLESAGWRVIKKPNADGTPIDVLQIAAKLYNPVTSWQLCELSVLVDGNGDGTPDQELLGTYLYALSNNAADTSKFVSALTDADKMRSIRREFEQKGPGAPEAIYTPAIIDALDFLNYAHSTVAVVEADLSQLAKTPAGDVNIRLTVEADYGTAEGDDVLGKEDKWLTLTPSTQGQAYVNLPEKVELQAGQETTVSLTQGGGKGDLIVYMPYNSSTLSNSSRDSQAKVLKPKFAP